MINEQKNRNVKTKSKKKMQTTFLQNMIYQVGPKQINKWKMF